MPKNSEEHSWTLKFFLRGLAPAAVIGALIGVLANFSREHFRLLNAVVGGVIIGLCCHSVVFLFQSLFGKFISRLSKTAGWIARGVLYTVAGTLGFLIGLVIVLLVIEGLPLHVVFGKINFLPPMMIAATIALVLGLAFYSYHVLKYRLEDSIAKLKEREYAEKELELARAIQFRLLPPAESEGPGYRVGARNLAAHFVAGDFYDVFPLVDGTLGLVVADVAGKGIGASLIMASVKAVLPLLAGGKSVDRTLSELNERLSRELGKREFVALAFAKFDPVTGRVQLANAGLPEPYLLRRDGAVSAVISSGTKLPLGVRSTASYSATDLQLERGDRFLMFSDGLAEALAAPGEPLGYERLASLVAADGRPNRPVEWLDHLFASIRSHTVETLDDDWTALLLERT